MYIERSIERLVRESLKRYPVVGLIGCRQVGKTTLAKRIKDTPGINAIYLDLELPSDIAKLEEPELYLEQFRGSLVIIDEIQRMPQLFPVIRALVDKRRVSGRFLILGSASPELIKRSSETLAGRVIYHELAPFGIYEVGISGINSLWLRGGIPESYLSNSDNESMTWRESFIRTYLERDIPQLGIRVPSLQLRRFWVMIAHMHGGVWNASSLTKGLGISAPTVRRYLDILAETFIVRQLEPYYSNIKKRLIKSPKIYIRDSGLLHALLMIKDMDALYAHPVVGSSWEGFVIEEIRKILPENRPMYFYRTSAGAEIDLLIFDKRNRPIAIEIKFSSDPRPRRGFFIAIEDLRCKRGFVIYPGEESYPLKNNILALSVKELELLGTY